MRSWPKLHWRQCSHKFLGQPNGNQSRPVVSHDPIPHISLAKMSSVIESVGTTTPKSRHIDSESIHFLQQNTMDPSHGDKHGLACLFKIPLRSSQSPQMPVSPLSTPCARHQWPPAVPFTSQKVWYGQIWISIGYAYCIIILYIIVGSIQCGWIVTSCQVDLCEARPSWRIAWLNYHLRWRDKCCYNSPTFKKIWLQRRIPLWIGKMLSRKVKGRNISKWGRIVGIHKLQ